MNSRKWHILVTTLLLVLISTACGKGGESGSSDGADVVSATVKGKVLDINGDPVAAATVVSQNASTTTQTGNDGTFSFVLNAGAHRLTVTKGKSLVVEQCLSVAEHITYDLGDIDPDTPTNCDVICTNGPSSVDRDCDGVPNDVEVAGWDVTILKGDGTTETRHVVSNPDMKDTDGDGLNDGEEFAARTDPSRKDTDGDLLSDYAEMSVYKSIPLNVDSDGDARGPKGDQPSDPNLWDGYELAYAGTSPTLADTDGDGLTDYEEIHSGGTNPLVANLPVLALDLYGDPNIELNVSSVEGCGSNSINLAREEKERVKTDNISTEMSIKNTVKLHTETKAGTSTWPPSFNAKLTTDSEFKQGYIHETSNNFTQTSVQEAQTRSECWKSKNVDFSNGKISVAIKLSNRSNLTFKVKELTIIAYQFTTGSNFRVVGTLEPDTWPIDGYILGPSSDLVLTVKKTDIGADVMEGLSSNPSALMFDIGGYSLFQLDEWGVNETVNYAKLGESVIQRTGLIVIDYGNGTVERYMVATNVQRNQDGSGRGVTLKEALSKNIGLNYETEVQKDENGNIVGRKVLKKVKTVETYQNDPQRLGRGFWVVSGTGDAFDKGIDVDFNNVVLNNGQRINLTYLQDTDLDGIFDNEEYLLGTDKYYRDSDGDGLSDYDEAKVGWTVTVRDTSYQVFPDPRFADIDNDFLTDGIEAVKGTDPYKADTDGDGLADTNDLYPLSPPSLDGNLLGLAAWWNGTDVTPVSPNVDADVWTTPGIGDPNGYASNAVLHGVTKNAITWKPHYLTTTGLNSIYLINPLLTQKDQYISVADNAALDPARSISPQAITLSSWVYWDGNSTGADWATVLTKGASTTANYSLLIKSDGTLKFSLYRSAHNKCYGWLFGWVDSLCADSDANRQEELLGPKVPKQKWVHVTATFSKADEMMRIYLDNDGALSSTEVSIRINWTASTTKGTWTTNNLVINNDPLLIGLDAADPASAQWPFHGMMDELQVFGREMTKNEATLFNEIGVGSQ